MQGAKQSSNHMGAFCFAAAASAAAAFAYLVQASTNTGVLFLDTFMKDRHIVNIALPWHAHLTLGLPTMCDSRHAVLVSDVPVSLDVFAWRPLCFR